MANLNVAVIGPNDYAKDLGKKGTVSDITLYDLKQGTDTVTLIEPTKYPDRLAPLFYAVSMADRALLVVDAINAQLGESMVMLQCADIKTGIHRPAQLPDPGAARPPDQGHGAGIVQVHRR